MKKVFGHFFSILFLPLLMPLYGTMLFYALWPYAYPVVQDNIGKMIQVGLLTFFFPAFTIGLLYKLKFINNVTMYERDQRILPYITSGFFYIWATVVFYRTGNNSYLTFIMLGSTIALFIDFLVNVLVIKVSMHTTGVGGMVAMLLVLFPYSQLNALPWLIAAIVIAGCVGAARLSLKAHTEREVYLGYLTGFFSFMVASNIITF